jgi:hypothetical protein
VTVAEGPTTLCTAVVAGGAWSCPSSTLADGVHTIAATQTDAAGNLSAGSPTVTFTVDATAPAAPAITAPTDGALLTTATPLIAGTGEDGSTVTLLEGPTSLCTSTVAGGVWSCVPVALTDGSHTVTATQTDAAGNVSAASAAVSFTIDTAAPAPPVITAPVDGTTTATASPTITGTGDAGAAVTVLAGTTILCTAAVVGTTWTCTPAALSDGTHTITATQADAAGNASGLSAPVTITVDTTVPDAPEITAPASGSTVAVGTPTVTGTGEDGATVTVLEGATPLCTATVAAGAWSCVTAALSDGPHTVAATQTDGAGNASAASAPVTFAVDTSAPAAPVITAPAGGAITANPTPDIAGTGETGATVTVVEGGTTVCTAVVTAGAWSCPAAPLADGPHTVTATQTDAARHVSPGSAAVSFTVDTVAPAALVITAPAGGSTIANPVPAVSGSGETGATVVVTEAGVTLCTAVVAAGSWSCTASGLADGPHTVTATQTDAAGLPSPPSAPVTFAVDTTPPAPPLLTAPASWRDRVPPRPPTFAGTGEDGATVTVAEGATVLCTAVVAAGAWSCVSSTMADGPHTITANQTDPVGNASGPGEPVTITIDTTPPAAPTIASPTDGTVTTNPATPDLRHRRGRFQRSPSSKDRPPYVTSTVVGGAWSCVPPVLADGPHTLTATQADAAGNASPASAPSRSRSTRPHPPRPSSPHRRAGP